MTPPPPEMTVRLAEVEITKEFDLAVLPEARVVFDRILSLHPYGVVIDLSECRYIDAAAIGLLLDVHRSMARSRGVLTLSNPDPRIRRILRITRVDQVLPVVTPGPESPPTGNGSIQDTAAITGRARAPVTTQC